MKKLYSSFIALAMLVSLSACEKIDISNKMETSTKYATTLTILAGSETKDMAPLLEKAEQTLGFNISVKYTGTIDGVEQIKNGATYDAAWFSQSKYFYDTEDGAKRIKISEKIMLSPVTVGVRKASYDKLGLKDGAKVSWADVSRWVTEKKLTYAMTDPSESNTGYVGLMGVAYSLAGKGENLSAADVNKEKMTSFFSGHAVNAGSSGWLVDAFAKSKADFMINYESSILQYNKQNPGDALVVIYPFEGIVTSDYPMLLIEQSKADQFKKLTEFLKSVESQKWIVENVARRAVNSQAMVGQTVLPQAMLIEMPFSPDPKLSEQLLSAYYKDFKRPAALIFVLDTSGSMNEGTREEDMKKAIEGLTVNVDTSSRFAKLREREKIWVLPFSGESYGLQKFEMGQTEAQGQATRLQINQYVKSLKMSGGTAIFSTTMQAVKILKDEMLKNPEYRYSVIVFTDGVNTAGMGSDDFISGVKKLGVADQVRVFPILFGEGKKTELENIANATGGRVFDGKNKSLSGVFKEIRSYQ